MYLEEVRNNGAAPAADISSAQSAGGAPGALVRETYEPVFAKWEFWPPSRISHHGTACCEIAREWLTATDHSQLGAGSKFTGPRWLRQVFTWGASTFPIYWCEAVREKKLDCGALAALALEIFVARGVKVFPAQLVQKYSKIATDQWTNNWFEDDNSPLPWVNKDLIYHEGCAVVTGSDNLKVWDASAGWWIDPKSSNGYGSLLALRVSTFEQGYPADAFTWGEHKIEPGSWYVL